MPINRRQFLHRSAVAAGFSGIAGPWLSPAAALANDPNDRILVVVELSGGNDGLNSIVPFADDAYYRHRPRIGLTANELLPLDDQYGFNPGMLGFQRLWQSGDLAIVHGCGYPQPSYSHFTSMAYWHTGVPQRGDAYGWMGRLADQMQPQRQENMLINVASHASLAVKSKVHTPVVFDDPERFARHRWMQPARPAARSVEESEAREALVQMNPTRAYLDSVNRSALASSEQIRQAWRDYKTPVDYGIAPMDLPKVAACINAGLSTPLYHVAFRNNAFDTHVQQEALHRRLLSYACDGINGFIQDLDRLGQAHRVVVLVYSEFGRRVPENANLGTDHGTANVMFMAGKPVQGGHYGQAPSLTELVDGDNLLHTTDFRQVYASAMQGWLGVDASKVLYESFDLMPLFG